MKYFNLPLCLSIGIITSYLATIPCHKQIQAYKKELTPEQTTLYEKIVHQRMWIFSGGMICAVVLAICYLFLSYRPLYYRISDALLIFLLVPIILYFMIPKCAYMLENMSTPEESNKWFQGYKCLGTTMLHGFFIGFIFSLLFLIVLDVGLSRRIRKQKN
jgi:tetrahydromethanopterin S-methyltransferase subunit F